MAHLLERRDPWGHGMGLWVLLGMLFLVPFAVSSLRSVRLENNVETWLPADDPQARTLDWYRNHFPLDDQVIVSWEGSSLDDPRLPHLIDRLEGVRDDEGIRRKGLPSVERAVGPGEIIERMARRGVPPAEAASRLQGVLLGPGPLCIRLTAYGRARKDEAAAALARVAQAELGTALEITDAPGSTPDGSFEPLDGELEEGLFAAEAAETDPARSAGPPAHDLRIAWPGMQARPEAVARFEGQAVQLRGPPSPEAPDGQPLVDSVFAGRCGPVAVAVALSEAGTADLTGTLDSIRRAAADVGIEVDALRLGGSPVAASELNQAVKRAFWNADVPLAQLHKRSPILLSMLTGIVLAFAMLGSLRLAVLVLITANFASLLAVVLVPATGGTMNMVLIVMPTLLSVLTLSAAIHVANYWKHAACRNLRTAVLDAARMARQPCLLAGVTTAVGLVSLSTSPLSPVRAFGIYSAVGCLISLVVVLYGLPALLQFWPAPAPRPADLDRAAWKRLAGLVTAHWRAVSLACVTAFAVSAAGLSWFRTETKVIRYFPDDARIVRDYNFLEDHLQGIMPVDLVVRFDDVACERLSLRERAELVRRIQDGMRVRPGISGTVSLADFLELPDPPPATAGFLQKARYHRTVHEIEERIKDGREPDAAAFLTVAREADDLPRARGENLAVAKGDELWRITAQVAVMSDLHFAELTGDWNRPDTHPGDLNVIARGVLADQPGTGHIVTGMVPLFLRTQEAVLESLILSFGLAFAVIGGVMMLLLRSPLAGGLVMLPNVMPVAVVFGLISWAGLAVDVGTMITASVALGIAVDGTLHLLTWFRAGLREGLPRAAAVTKALAHCGPAMWQTSAAVGVGLLMFAQADLLMVSRFGWLMSALMGAALVADVILLPALLAGPLGALIERTDRRRGMLPDEPPALPPKQECPQPHLLARMVSHEQATR